MNENITDVIFYTIEKAIKSYRKFAQKRIDQAKLDVTIDQWLVLNCLSKNENISQNKLAELIFKDVASVTRIIDLLVKKEYLIRSFHSSDRRRFNLTITDKGDAIIRETSRIVNENRSTALENISAEEVKQADLILQKLIANCEKPQ
jgi:DNA-binding MarR family transcriptional regulator